MSDYHSEQEELPLWGSIYKPPDLPKRFAKWLKFHRNHPRVWNLFYHYAKEAKLAGRKKFSARMIWERMRWYCEIESKEEYKLNDHYPPYYARLLMLWCEEFEGFFSIRDAKFDVDEETFRRECGPWSSEESPR